MELKIDRKRNFTTNLKRQQPLDRRWLLQYFGLQGMAAAFWISFCYQR